MPRYPIYPSQPLTGNLPSMVAMGPPDTRASSGPAPSHARRLMHGRHLSGFGAEDSVPMPTATNSFTPAPRVPSDDTSELRRMEGEDDAQGNGIFDSDRRRPISYPDAGIFANKWAMPGYINRSKSFATSEVKDITTGRSVVYVPSGAVSVDDNAKLAFMMGQSYMPLRNYMSDQNNLPMMAIDSVAVNPAAITAIAAVEQDPNVKNNTIVPEEMVSASAPTPVDVPTTSPAQPASGGISNFKLALIAGAVGFGLAWLMSPNKEAQTSK